MNNRIKIRTKFIKQNMLNKTLIKYSDKPEYFEIAKKAIELGAEFCHTIAVKSENIQLQDHLLFNKNIILDKNYLKRSLLDGHHNTTINIYIEIKCLFLCKYFKIFT